MFDLTLTAHGHLPKCLACALKDGWLFSHRFVAVQDDLDIAWIELEPAAMPAGLFAGDECRSRTEEWAEDDVEWFVKAAAKGSVQAMYNLEVFFERDKV